MPGSPGPGRGPIALSGPDPDCAVGPRSGPASSPARALIAPSGLRARLRCHSLALLYKLQSGILSKTGGEVGSRAGSAIKDLGDLLSLILCLRT